MLAPANTNNAKWNVARVENKEPVALLCET